MKPNPDKDKSSDNIINTQNSNNPQSKNVQNKSELQEKITMLISENSNLKSQLSFIQSENRTLQANQKILEENSKNYDNLYNEHIKLLEDFSKLKRQCKIKEDNDNLEAKISNENDLIKMENANKINKLNDLLYYKILKLEDDIKQCEINEKIHLEKLELQHQEKMANFKKKLINFLKREHGDFNKSVSQKHYLTDKMNNMHICQLISEINGDYVIIEDLLKEKSDLNKKIYELKNDLSIITSVLQSVFQKLEKVETIKKLKKDKFDYLRKIDKNKTNNLEVKHFKQNSFRLKNNLGINFNNLNEKKGLVYYSHGYLPNTNIVTTSSNVNEFTDNKVELSIPPLKINEKKTINIKRNLNYDLVRDFHIGGNQIKDKKLNDINTILCDDNIINVKEHKDESKTLKIQKGNKSRNDNNFIENLIKDISRCNNQNEFDYYLKTNPLISKHSLIKEIILKDKQNEHLNENIDILNQHVKTMNSKALKILMLIDEVLTRIYNEDMNKELKNIYVNVNDFMDSDFSKLDYKLKYAILMEIAKCILPAISKENSEGKDLLEKYQEVVIKKSSYTKDKEDKNSCNERLDTNSCNYSTSVYNNCINNNNYNRKNSFYSRASNENTIGKSNNIYINETSNYANYINKSQNKANKTTSVSFTTKGNTNFSDSNYSTLTSFLTFKNKKYKNSMEKIHKSNLIYLRQLPYKREMAYLKENSSSKN